MSGYKTMDEAFVSFDDVVKKRKLAPTNVSPTAPTQSAFEVGRSAATELANAIGARNPAPKSPTTLGTSIETNVPQMPANSNFGLASAALKANNIPEPEAPKPLSDEELYRRKFEEKALNDAAIEAARRKAAAQNLYDSTLSNLSAEEYKIEPMYNDTVKEVNQGAFNNSEAMKEMMNMYGWGMDNSGLAVGEVGKINIKKDQDLNKVKLQKDAALADIIRRRTLAKSLLDSSNAETESWTAAQKRSGEAEAFLKAKDYARQSALDKLNENIALAKLGMDEAGVTGVYKGKKTAGQSNIEFTQDLSADQLALQKRKAFEDATGMTQIDDSMIAADSPLRQLGDYAGFIKSIQSNPQWFNDPSSRFNVAASIYLRNKAIMDDPIKKEKYGNTLNEFGNNLIPTTETSNWNKTFDEQVRQYNTGRTDKNSQFDSTFNETVRHNKATEGADWARIEASKEAAKTKADGVDSTVVSSAYTDYKKSGKKFDEWINTAGKNGVRYGDVLTGKELDALVGILSRTGEFKTDNNELLKDLIGDN